MLIVGVTELTRFAERSVPCSTAGSGDLMCTAVPMSFRSSVLPGFGLTLGFTTFFLRHVLLPLALALAAASMHWSDFLHVVLSPRALALPLSFGALPGRHYQPGVRLHHRWTLVRTSFRAENSSTRSSICLRAAHGGSGSRSPGVCAQRLDRTLPGAWA